MYSKIESGTMGHEVGSKQVSEERKQCVLDVFYMGVKQKDIFEYYKMPQSTVANIIRRGKSSSTIQRGRNQKLSNRSIRNMLSYAWRKRFTSVNMITAKFNEFSPTKVCVNTVRSILHTHCIKN